MTQGVDGQPAYVLHRRAYRETSALVELLTRDFGRLSGVLRGVKGGRRRTHDIEPFGRVAVTWRGRGQLVTLFRSEPIAPRYLAGNALFAGLYINELLVKTLGHEEPVTALFDHYEEALDSLARTGAENGTGSNDLEPILRTFERLLLDELGYGIAFDMDVDNGRPIEQDKLYRFVDGEGFREVDDADGVSSAWLFGGRQIAAIGAGEYRDRSVRQAAKQILRRAIAMRLNGKPLQTRRLFASQAQS